MGRKNRRDEIITAARDLFYTEGFTNTTLEMIAGACDIQKQLITYYFKTKEELAFLVYRLSLQEMYHAFKDYGEKELPNGEVDILVSSFLYFSRYYTDVPNPCRFYREFIGKSLIPIEMLRNTYNELSGVESQIPLYENFLEFTMHFNAAMSLLRYYVDGQLEITKDEFEYDFLVALFTVNDDIKRNMHAIRERAASFLTGLNIECGTGFRISIIKKN